MEAPRAGEELSTRSRTHAELDARACALRALTEAGIRFLVAGAYAFFEYTGIFRDTKDLDIFLRRRDLPAAREALERAGFRTELLDPVWLAKGYSGAYFVDLIFSSGNSVAVVDDGWFEHAWPGTVMGIPCLLAPPEEIIWSKAFVTERERYDGADVNHLILACGDRMDWTRLLDRFAGHWELLFSHVVLFGFVYPSERDTVPAWVVEEMCRRLLEKAREGGSSPPVCRGRLLSRIQYQQDYEHFGFEQDGPVRHGPRHRKVPPRSRS